MHGVCAAAARRAGRAAQDGVADGPRPIHKRAGAPDRFPVPPTEGYLYFSMHNARIHMGYFVGRSQSTGFKLVGLLERVDVGEARRDFLPPGLRHGHASGAQPTTTVCFHIIGNVETMHD